MKLLRMAMTLIVVFLVFYLLHIGQALLLPFVIAVAIVYLINILTHTICMLRIGEFSLPRPIAMVFAVAVILAALTLVAIVVVACLGWFTARSIRWVSWPPLIAVE